MPRLNLTFFFLFTVVGIIFLLFPQIDIIVSSLFYHNGFDKYYLPYIIIYKGVGIIAGLSFIILVVLFILSFLGKYYRDLTRKKLLFLLLAIILGPGLMVNTILKDNWGRARPNKIIQFGGEATYTPPLIISKECNKNCSFVCGHASAGFVIVALAFLFKRREKEIFITSLFAGFFIGLVRVAQGGHFLSDVIFSFFFTYLTIRLLYYFMFRNSDESIIL